MRTSTDKSFLPLLLVLALGGLASCAFENEGIPPPGFEGTPARFFYPTALELSADGQSLYVVNSDFDRAFSSGSIVQVDLKAFDESESVRELAPFVLSQGRISRFGQQLARSASTGTLFVPSPDGDLLVPIPTTGAEGRIACANDRCQDAAVDLGAVGLSDPVSLTLAQLLLPGSEDVETVLLVAPSAPPLTLDEEDLGTASARLAVLPERLATRPAQPFDNGAFTIPIGPGATDILFDESSASVLLGGCYERVERSASAFECGVNVTSAYYQQNPLRSLTPELGAEAPISRTVLGAALGGGLTTALKLSSDGTRLYTLAAEPDVLLVTARPVQGQPVSTLGVVALPEVPRAMAVLPHPDGDLVVVTALESDALVIVDPSTGIVVTQLRPLGASPFGLAVKTEADHWRIFVSLFEGCSVVAVDVPFADPSSATLVQKVGVCP